ncbi:MAG: ECF-type sigma factor [Acidobacteriota bacterium]
MESQQNYLNQPRNQENITQLLDKWRSGDRDALDRLIPLVYKELYRLAQYQFARQSAGHTLQATALVNEVYLRLNNSKDVDFKNRVHFLAVCATIMRRILIDRFRHHHHNVQLDEAMLVLPKQEINLLELDEVLSKLATFDPRKSQIIEMRFFGGMTMKEIAEVLQISEITVKREWGRARGWLLRELGGKGNA